MYDQVVDYLRKATDSTLQFQQDLFRNWCQIPGVPTPGSVFANGVNDQLGTIQRKWADAVVGMLNKHRESLDAQYRAGIRVIEDAFRAADAKDPAQFRKLTEELWRQYFNSLKTGIETQMRDYQAALEKALEAVSQGMTAGKA